jgi:tRNA U34 2-thiouridine synthase MnmA/TrmU
MFILTPRLIVELAQGVSEDVGIKIHVVKYREDFLNRVRVKRSEAI